MFNSGISREGDILDLGVAKDIIKKSGAYYSYGDIRLGQGRENAKEFLLENTELCQKIEQEIRSIASRKAKASPSAKMKKQEPVPDLSESISD